jgi:hypothetical protein
LKFLEIPDLLCLLLQQEGDSLKKFLNHSGIPLLNEGEGKYSELKNLLRSLGGPVPTQSIGTRFKDTYIS